MNGRCTAPRKPPALHRLLKACAIVVGLVIAGVLVQAVIDGSQSGVLEKIDMTMASDDAGFDTGSSAASAPVPEGFQDEVLSLEGREDVRVGADGTVVGFVDRAGAQEAFASLRGELEDTGWTAIDSGRDDCGSFVKDEGRFTWLFASCVPTGSATSVVISIAGPAV